MKEIFKPLFILLAAISMTSCTDMLDIKPTTFVSDDLIWQDKKLIDQFVANTYGTLVCGFNRNTQGWDQDWAAAFGGNFDAGADDFDGKFDAIQGRSQRKALRSSMKYGRAITALSANVT